MAAETPLKCMGPSDEENTGGGQLQSPADLRETSPLITIHDTNEADELTTEHNSPTKCPESDISPSKARNRKRNDAKRRSANLKKQTANTGGKQQQKSSTQTSPKKQPCDNEDRILNSSDTNTPVQSNKPTTQTSNENNEGVDKGPGANSIDRRDRQHEAAKEKLKELKELKEQTKAKNSQIQSLTAQIKQQTSKIKELETVLLSTTKTCNQLNEILQKELASRASLEAENHSLNQTILRLKAQLTAHEKSKFNNDELVRVLNATLMERETEVSILKLKLTRIQTNPSSTLILDTSSNVSLIKNDPCRNYSSTGRSNSEFDRNSYIRSSMIAEAASVRASTSQLKSCDKDASVWAKVPEELTPSRRPQMLEDNFDSSYGESHYNNPYSIVPLDVNSSSTSLSRDRRYKTMPRSLRSNSRENFGLKDPTKSSQNAISASANETAQCQVTNLDDSNNSSHSSGNKTNTSSSNYCESKQQPSSNYSDVTANTSFPDAVNMRPQDSKRTEPIRAYTSQADSSPYSTIDRIKISSNNDIDKKEVTISDIYPPSLPERSPSTQTKVPTGLKRILHRFRRADSSSGSQSKTDLTNSPKTAPSTPFKRGGNRSTTVGAPSDIRAQMTPIKQVMNFQTDKPFAEWDTDMLIDWLTMIGLSMYTAQCRRWVKCGAHIMNATPTEVDKGLGITNHLHRKKLRLAISELNGDCDKVTKAAARLDYLWVARWLDDIGLPQYKEAFINARVDGRVLNYLTVEDLVSLGVKSVMHHASIRCGIRVLRSINFDLQLLKRRATAEEVEHMNLLRQQVNLTIEESNELRTEKSVERNTAYEADVPLWTCHRIMEWLRMIDFAEFAPNLRGSGVHGGLVVFEDGFNTDTMCAVLSIPISRTLLRRHLSSYFISLIGTELVQRKRRFQDISSNQQLNPMSEIKTPKKSQLWFTKLKGSKVGQDGLDEYLCPMYPVEPQIIKSKSRKSDVINRIETQPLSNIPESVNV